MEGDIILVFFARVNTPNGPGNVIAMDANNPNCALVQHARVDYSTEEWKKFTPHNGPCVTRRYSLDEITAERQQYDVVRRTNGRRRRRA